MKVRLLTIFSDRIYQYIDTFTVQEKYQLDFSGKGLPPKYLDMSFDDIRNTDYYFFMGDYTENETHECIQIQNWSKESHRTIIFRDKISGKLKGGCNFLDDGKIFMLTAPFTTYKDEFVSAFEPYNVFQLLSALKKDENQKVAYNHLKELFGHLEEDDNPIVVKYRLKSFN